MLEKETYLKQVFLYQSTSKNIPNPFLSSYTLEPVQTSPCAAQHDSVSAPTPCGCIQSHSILQRQREREKFMKPLVLRSVEVFYGRTCRTY